MTVKYIKCETTGCTNKAKYRTASDKAYKLYDYYCEKCMKKQTM